MKLLSVIILLICLTANTLSQWIVIACFDLNETYVAKELCVNKNNPDSHCNGHCVLNNKLNTDEKNAPANSASKEKFEVQPFCVNENINSKNDFSFVIKHCITTQSFTMQQVLFTCFHPPAC
ncbi:MAG TPA: hypothetical protein PLA68_10785 [Panacibacter sp.]|nr:hypothetical protein [Panacibacter sp.]